MQQNLELSEGDNVKVDNVSLPIATYAKFQPLHEEFLDINNPKAVLENTLRNFGCLTKGDNLIIYYNDHEYQLTVLELKPANAVCVIECDVNVEFAEALIKSSHGPEPMDTSGSPTVPAAHAVAAAVQPVVPSDPFSSCGVGRRLDGKVIRNENGKTTSTASASTAPVSQGRESSTVPKSASAWSSRPSSAVNGQLPERGIPNYNHTPGRVTFNRIAVDANAPSSTEATQQQKSEKESERGPVPFAGAGHQLRPTRKHWSLHAIDLSNVLIRTVRGFYFTSLSWIRLVDITISIPHCETLSLNGCWSY